MKNPMRSLLNLYRSWHGHRKSPLRVEFVVTDHCNLNCKGCTHYSPLAPDEMEDFAILERNIMHIGKTCGADIAAAYLIGGETLLYPRLCEAMRALRRGFPQSRLYVFTNGIALPRMSDEFWDTCRSEGIVLAVTRYPIKIDYDRIIELCHEKGVETEVFGDRSMADSFFRFALDPTKSQNRRMSHFKCYNRGCISVIGDRIYPCSISACVGHLNKACGTKFEHTRGDYLTVTDVTCADRLKRLRDRPVPFCGYCINPPSTVTYGPSRRAKEEWVEE